jgi:hypothetical protein
MIWIMHVDMSTHTGDRRGRTSAIAIDATRLISALFSRRCAHMTDTSYDGKTIACRLIDIETARR